MGLIVTALSLIVVRRYAAVNKQGPFENHPFRVSVYDDFDNVD